MAAGNARGVYIDELRTGEKYLVWGADLNKDPLVEEIEMGKVEKTGYNPLGKDKTVLDRNGFSGTSYHLSV